MSERDITDVRFEIVCAMCAEDEKLAKRLRAYLYWYSVR